MAKRDLVQVVGTLVDVLARQLAATGPAPRESHVVAWAPELQPNFSQTSALHP